MMMHRLAKVKVHFINCHELLQCRMHYFLSKLIQPLTVAFTYSQDYEHVTYIEEHYNVISLLTTHSVATMKF